MECVSFDHIKRRRFGQTLRNKWRFSCFSRFPEPFLSCFEWTCSFMGKSVKSGRIVNLLLASQSQKADVFFLVRHPWSSVAMHEKTRSYTYIKAQPKMPDWNVLEHFNLASWAVSNSLLSPDIRAVRSFEKHIGSRKSINTKPGPKFSLNRAFQFTFWNSWQKHWPPLLAGFHSKYVLKELKETQWPPVPQTHKCLKHMRFCLLLTRSLW